MNGLLTKEQVVSIPDRLLPAFILSDNARSFFGLLIRQHDHGVYDHFMSARSAGWFLSQDMLFKEVQAEGYLQGKHRLKIWVNEHWTTGQRKAIFSLMEKDLRQKWWKRLYDPVAIIGQALNQNWLQIPGINICSDSGQYLEIVDGRYDLCNPSPADLNAWLEEQAALGRGYKIYGRYIPD